jgi:uncharacterized RDD family membrane protein YckC
MVVVMNAIAQVSAAPVSGPKLDNRRVLAAIVDLLIVAAGAVVVLYAGDSLTGDRQGALGAVILGWALYYYFALESGGGQTVGKKLMKLRVVRADGHEAGMREIAVRTVLRVIDGIALYMVGLIVMLVTGERRQRIGDLAASTIVVDASAPATAVAAPPAAAEVEDAADVEDEDAADEEPVAEAAAPTQTITLPSRPARPETLSDLADPAADEAVEEAEPAVEDAVEEAGEPVVEAEEPVVEAEEPVVEAEEPVVEAEEPVVEVEPVVEDSPADEPVVEVEPYEVASYEVEPYDMETLDDERAAWAEVADEPVAEEPVVEVVAQDPVAEDEPVAEEALPPVMSPSLEGLAADVAAAHEAGPEADEAAQMDAAPEADAAPEDDAPVNVKSVETVSAMDLIMGAAEEDAAKSDEDEGPASA